MSRASSQFPEAFHGAQAGGRQFAQQEHAVQDAAQFLEEFIDSAGGLGLIAFRQKPLDNPMVAVLEGIQLFQIGIITRSCQTADGNQAVGASSDGRTDHDGPVFFEGLLDDADDLKHRFRCSDGTAAKFQYLHRIYFNRMADSLAVSSKKPSWPNWDRISMSCAPGIQAVHSRPSSGGKMASVSTATTVTAARIP